MTPRTPERTTKRQREVLAAIDEGLDAEAIAEKLGISENTLRQLTRRLLARFPGRVSDLPANARKAGVEFTVSSPVTAVGLTMAEAAEAQELVESLDREPRPYSVFYDAENCYRVIATSASEAAEIARAEHGDGWRYIEPEE